ncbi:MAG: hypothetical protein ACRDDH_18195 [Cetobacterium sp.]
MTQKKSETGLWKFKINGITLEGTYEECTQKVEALARMWEV